VALTKFNYNSFDLTTAASKGLAFNSDADGFETSSAGSMTLIKTLTASSSGTLSFVDGASSVVLDNTYPVYKFEFINIHPQTDGVKFTVGFRDGDTAYDATKTSTYFEARHNEGDTGTSLVYEAGEDLANGTGFQPLQRNISNDADHGTNGTLHLFNPSSTTFVKHFITRTSGHHQSDYELDTYVSGYCNVTAAIDAVQFKMDSGNIDAGTIKLYGIKDS
jgi:hypothetical protein